MAEPRENMTSTLEIFKAIKYCIQLVMNFTKCYLNVSPKIYVLKT